MKKVYIVTDNSGTVVFTEKEKATEFIISIILDKMADPQFALSVFKSFWSYHDNKDFFENELKKLVTLAYQKDPSLEPLLATWNSIFMGDAIRIVEGEMRT